jgi:hypothetical protein
MSKPFLSIKYCKVFNPLEVLHVNGGRFVQLTNSSSMQRGAFYVHAFYRIPFCSQLFCQVQTSLLVFLNFTLPNLKVCIHILFDLAIWLFCQVHWIGLPTPLSWIAKFTLPNCQVHIPESCIPKLPTPHCYLAIWPVCKIVKSTSPCALPKWASSCP